MRALTLAAITSFAVCGLGVDDWMVAILALRFMGASPLLLPFGARHVTYMPNATWRRRGVATARGGGSPTLETERSGSGKGGAQRRAAQAKRGRLGKPLAGARGGAPLSCTCCCFCDDPAGCICRPGHRRFQGRRCGQEQA